MKALRIWLGVLAVALILGGCGQASSKESSTIRFWSPAVQANGVISPRVSCGAGTIWLPLKWGTLPDGTKELVLYFGWFKDKAAGGRRKIVVPFGSVIYKIKPSAHGIAANTLPSESEFLYFTLNNCQPVRKGQSYLVELFALGHPQQAVPETLNASFVTGITEEALGKGRFAGDSEVETRLREEALAVGRLTATYGPKPK
jgi:phosphatidylethanolamine-binding protein (PEBP) family uncharacterized protein